MGFGFRGRRRANPPVGGGHQRDAGEQCGPARERRAPPAEDAVTATEAPLRSRIARSIFSRCPSQTPRSLRCWSVKSGRTAISMSFSANVSAYSDMPSFLSQSKDCCIVATEVASWLSFGPRQQRVYTDKSAIPLLKRAGQSRSRTPWKCPGQMPCVNCDLSSKQRLQPSPQIVN